MIISSSARTALAGLRALLVLTVIIGIGYTGVITGVGQLLFHDQANGSLIRTDGKVVGSRIIGENFTDAKGAPLARYFQPRPSVAGDDGYDGASSGGSNLGPENKELAKTVRQRKAQVASFNGVDPSRVPPDAVTASSSGLDPDISTAYADIQVARVARARNLKEQTVRDAVAAHTSGPTFGFMGERRVNVVELNRALDNQEG